VTPVLAAHPQNWFGAGSALIPEKLVAFVTALEIKAAWNPCATAYWAPA
jgi:hypothetical protein